MQLLESIRRAFRWRRRMFAALLAAVAVLASLNVLTSHRTDGTPVVVAARTIAAGTTLTASELMVAELPPALVTEGAVSDPDELVGRAVVVEVPARSVLTPSLLLGDESQVSPGRVALPVRFGLASTTSLLRVGVRLDVLGATASGSGFGTVAADVRVVAVPAAANTGLGGGESPIVLLDVTSDQAAAIVAASSASSLSFALR